MRNAMEILILPLCTSFISLLFINHTGLYSNYLSSPISSLQPVDSFRL